MRGPDIRTSLYIKSTSRSRRIPCAVHGCTNSAKRMDARERPLLAEAGARMTAHPCAVMRVRAPGANRASARPDPPSAVLYRDIRMPRSVWMRESGRCSKGGACQFSTLITDLASRVGWADRVFVCPRCFESAWAQKRAHPTWFSQPTPHTRSAHRHQHRRLRETLLPRCVRRRRG